MRVKQNIGGREYDKRNQRIRTRFRASKARKQERVSHLVEVMKEEYENRTGKPANYVMVL